MVLRWECNDTSYVYNHGNVIQVLSYDFFFDYVPKNNVTFTLIN